MLQSMSVVNVANGVAIDVAYDVLPVNPFRIDQSKLLFHELIKWFRYILTRKR